MYLNLNMTCRLDRFRSFPMVPMHFCSQSSTLNLAYLLPERFLNPSLQQLHPAAPNCFQLSSPFISFPFPSLAFKAQASIRLMLWIVCEDQGKPRVLSQSFKMCTGARFHKRNPNRTELASSLPKPRGLRQSFKMCT